jgi:hypothetical protein
MLRGSIDANKETGTEENQLEDRYCVDVGNAAHVGTE